MIPWYDMSYLEYEPTADTQEPIVSHTHNNTQHTTKNIKHHYHLPPKPPASSGSNFTGECNHRMSRNQSRSLQHGNVTFINKTNCSVILFTIIFTGSGSAHSQTKGEFYKLLLVLFLRNCIRTTRTNLSYLAIFYLPIPHKY
jgi:hypothetical protein